MLYNYSLYVLTLSEKNPGHILIQHSNELRREIKQMFIGTKVVTLSPVELIQLHKNGTIM